MLSTADITNIIISVTFAPLALKFWNASWPGVSINVTSCPCWVLIVNAPIDCVIWPYSFAAIDYFPLIYLNASKSVVFPWSTCPIIVTTGALFL